jgi:hypothetical protein
MIRARDGDATSAGGIVATYVFTRRQDPRQRCCDRDGTKQEDDRMGKAKAHRIGRKSSRQSSGLPLLGTSPRSSPTVDRSPHPNQLAHQHAKDRPDHVLPVLFPQRRDSPTRIHDLKTSARS